MATEIERKFLVNGNVYRELAACVNVIEQGYLNTDPNRTVRIRHTQATGFIASPKMTVKGKSSVDGLERAEIEFPICLSDYSSMIDLCEAIIRKHRYIVPFFYSLDGLLLVCVEVDEFQGSHLGLVVAEIEYSDRELISRLPLPEWLGEEVTGDVRYYNSNLAKAPTQHVS